MKFEGQIEGREIEPRGARIPVRYDALVQCELGEVEAKILNVSGRGFRLLSSCALEPGAKVSVKVGKLEAVGATIRWANGLEAGGVFLDAIAL